MMIKALRSTMVRPALPTPRHSLWMSNIDLTVARFHMSTVFLYVAPKSGIERFFDATVLEDALAKVLVPFYPMAGWLRRDEDGKIEVDCNAEGVLLVEAEADCGVLSDFGDFAQTEEAKQLAPKVDCSEGISCIPLLVLQVTRFKCGNVSLGISMHHVLADGFSAFHFIKSWADVARGAGIATAPHHDRTLLRARAPPTPSFAHVEYQPPPSMNSTTTTSPASTTNSTAMFEFTRAQLNMLKEMPEGDGYSSFVILAGHVWRCVSLARGLPHDQSTRLYIAIDGRARLELPRGYFGNAIFVATPMAEARELIAGHAVTGAKKIKEFFERMDDEYMRSTLDYLEVQPDLSKLLRGAHTFRSPNLCITTWAWFPLYDIDFGWGRPVFGGPLGSSGEGRVVVLPGAKGDGSISLIVTLPSDHLDRFRELIYLL